jgi:glycerol-3-phosphate acyltransferase PlsY
MVYLHWQTAVMALTIWLVGMAFTRTVSLSSLIAAVSTPILLILWQGEIAYQLLAGVGALYIIYTHRANVQRLLKGEEHSFAPKI